MASIEIKDSDGAYLVLEYQNLADAQAVVNQINLSENAKAYIIPEEDDGPQNY